MNWIDVTSVNLTETKPALAKVKIHSFGTNPSVTKKERNIVLSVKTYTALV